MNLRPYQEEDKLRIMDMLDHHGVGVFNEQRTGKTPTSLSAMSYAVNGKILIVCTASMVYTWAEEAKNWTSRRVFVYSGTKKQRTKELEDWSNTGTGILIISYDLFKTTKVNEGLKYTIRDKIKPEGLIVDEVHRCVGRKTANFKSLRYMVQIPKRLYLTGTPAPNHPAQVWSILTMIAPKEFSSYWRFVEDYFQIEEQRLPAHIAAMTGRGHTQSPSGFIPGKKEDYINTLNKYGIMRKRKDVMPWLPAKEPPNRIKLPPTPPQLRALRELEEFFETGDVVVQGILDQLLRLRQICLAPEILGIKSQSPKLNWLDTYLKDYPDRSVVVFSRFTQFLRLAEKKMRGDVGVIVGDVPSSKRKVLLDSFQNGKIKVLLIQIDAGKEGLTLDRADTMIFTDTYPPASDILQARDRIVSTHPDRVKPQEIIELAIANTYDEALYELVDMRMDSVDVANNYINYIKERK